VRHSERYHTVTGKDFRPRRIDLGGWRYLTCGLALLLVFIITIVPLIMMIYASLLTFYQAPSMAAFKSMSLDNYTLLFFEPGRDHADDQQHVDRSRHPRRRSCSWCR